MIEFIDKTDTLNGTALNRRNMMAIQGFIGTHTRFNSDGSITQVNDGGQTLTTTFNADGSITQVLVGIKTITKTTTFNSDGSITEVIS